MGFVDFVKTDTTSNNKFISIGHIYLDGVHGKHRERTFDFRVPRRERKYLMYIFPTMLSAYGGDFDEDDTVYVDIYSVDGIRRDSTNGFGGVWGSPHFGKKGDVKNMGISSWVGYVNQYIRFRLSIDGDDLAGASFIVMEL